MKKRKIAHTLLHATEGVISTITDLILVQTYFLFLLPGRTSPYKIYRAQEEAQRMLDSINYETIKQTLYELTKQGYIKRTSKRSSMELEITELGKKRIASLFPMYHIHRPWDSHIYLISYDIPVQANRKRTVFREFLKRSGCAMLQASLWITPYAPQGIIEEFVRTHKPGGTILVSKLGKDGAIGEEKLEDLIRRVYALDQLQERYEHFITTYTSRSLSYSLAQITIDYYAILKQDPQLPFALLPKDFPDRKAYELYQSKVRN